MSINQIEDYTGSQFAAIATRLRILFDHVLRKFFRKPQKYSDTPYRAVVAVSNPRSALRFRRSGGLVSGFVINRYGSECVRHDATRFRSRHEGFPQGGSIIGVDPIGQQRQ